MTHVHTHTKLSIQMTFKIIESVFDSMPNLSKEGPDGLNKALAQCLQYGLRKFEQKVAHCAEKESRTVSFSCVALPPYEDVRLDSFIAYLLKNVPRDRKEVKIMST